MILGTCEWTGCDREAQVCFQMPDEDERCYCVVHGQAVIASAALKASWHDAEKVVTAADEEPGW